MKEILYKSYKDRRSLPKNLLNKDSKLFEHEYIKKIPDSYLFRSKNITYFNSIILSISRLRYFKKYSFFGDKTMLERFKRIIKNYSISNKNEIIIEKGIWFTDHKSHVYFHWILDSLQRAEISYKYQKEYPLLVPEELYEIAFVSESLEHLGFEYKVLDKNQIYKLKEVVIISKTAQTGNYNKYILDNLVKRFFSFSKKEKSSPNKNLFILRKQKRGRNIKNLHEIESILEKYNFETIEFENFNFKEKIKLLSNCKNLVGIFGSGLTNMIFMKKNTNVIEIRRKNDDKNNAFFSLASSMNINYFYLFFEFGENGLEINVDNFEYLVSRLP